MGSELIKGSLNDINLDISSEPNRPLVVDLGLDDINLDISSEPNRPLVVDLGLDDVNLDVGGTGTAIGVEVGGTGTAIELQVGSPQNLPLVVNLGLNDINLDIGSEAGKPLVVDLGLDDVNVDLGLDNIKVDLGLDNINACLSLAVTEVPRVRVHMPTTSEFGFNLFGKPIFSFTFKGDTMVATEDNPPRVFLQPEEDASSQQCGDDVAYTVTLRDESDET